MTDQEKAYKILSTYLSSIQNKMTKYKISGLNPPEYLVKRFEYTKRKLKILAKAREE